jgi:hypothetical protein
MNDYVYQNARDKLDGYFLSFFKPFEFEYEETDNAVILGVPGGVSFERRNYDLLLDVCAGWQGGAQSVNVKFNIVGNINSHDGKVLRQRVADEHMERFFLFHDRLDDRAFSREISRCDYLLPLIGPMQSQYLKGKNSATLSHAARYSKPLIITEESMHEWSVPQECCVTYTDVVNLRETLSQLKKCDAALINNFSQYIESKVDENRQLLTALEFKGKV